jgi:hypothetical protein
MGINVAYDFPGNQGEEQKQEQQPVETTEVQAQKEQEQPQPKESAAPRVQGGLPKEEEPAKEQAQEPEKEEAKVEEKPKQEEKKEIGDDEILAKLKERGFTGDSIEDLLKPKETPKQKREVDEATQKFLDYQERTGRGLEDYAKLNEDYKKMDPIDIAKDKLRRESPGVEYDDQELNFLLEKELGFDPTEEMDESERAQFKKYYGSHLSTLEKERQKYNEPVDGYEPSNAEQKASQPEDGGEKITLSNGTEVDKATYEKERADYLKLVDESLQDIKEQKFTVSIDGKDGKEDLAINYNLTEEDLHGVKSKVEDIGSILNSYQKEDGFDMKGFEAATFWMDEGNRQKAVSAMARQIHSQVVEKLTAERRNVNFNAPGNLPKQDAKGYVEPGQSKHTSGPRVQYTLQD